MLVHRRAKFRAAPASVQALADAAAEGKVELVTPCQLHGLEGDGSTLAAVTVADDTGARAASSRHLLALFGIATELGPIADWGLHIDHQQIAIDPATSETSRPGIYAVGDITIHPGKLKLILTGFAETAAAAHAIYKRLNPGKVLHFEHSTTAGVPPHEPVGSERAIAALPA
jgi:thioredoxin reductase (NADPH)